MTTGYASPPGAAIRAVHRVLIILQFSAMKLLASVVTLFRGASEAPQKMHEPGNKSKFEDLVTMGTFLTWKKIIHMSFIRSNDKAKPIRQGKELPDVPVYTLEGESLSLCSLLSQGRPTVLNFGSLTWGPFMGKVSSFNALVQQYSDVADFVTVYVREAHAADSLWPMGKYALKQQTEMEDRIAAAKTLQEVGISGRLLVDSMDDLSAYVYGSLPERLIVVERSKVIHLSGVGPGNYNLDEVEDVLKKIK